jgi:plastocyanin
VRHTGKKAKKVFLQCKYRFKKEIPMVNGKKSLQVMKKRAFRMLVGEAVIGGALALFMASFAFGASGGGTVSGTIHVKKAYVETTGPKSDKDVVVYLVPVPNTTFPAPTEKAQMNQLNLAFVPHVLAVQKGTNVDFLNQDAVNHNVSSPAACCSFDLGQWGKGVVKTNKFDTTGVAPLLCSLHPEMSAYVVVVDTPYFTTASLVTNEAEKKQYASYSIKGVPAGQYKLKVWNGKLKAEDQLVTVTDGAAASGDIDIHK